MTATVYWGCAAAFISLIALMILRGRTSKTGLAILACCVVSVVWAGANALSGNLSAAALALIDDIRLSACLLFAVHWSR